MVELAGRSRRASLPHLEHPLASKAPSHLVLETLMKPVPPFLPSPGGRAWPGRAPHRLWAVTEEEELGVAHRQRRRELAAQGRAELETWRREMQGPG